LVAAKCHSAELSDGLRFSPQRMMETIFSILGCASSTNEIVSDSCQRFVFTSRWARAALTRKRALKPIGAQVSAEVCWPSLSSHGGHPAVGANNGNIHQVLRKEPHLKLVGSDHVGNE